MDKKTAKKNEIIKNSIHVMIAKGYNGTGVKDLTDAAGIPKGSLYNYFANKEDYAKEALYYYYNEMGQERFSYLADKSLKSLDRIKKFFWLMIEDFNDKRNCKLGCFIGNLTQEMGGVNETLSKVTDELYSGFERQIRNCLFEAVHNNEISNDKNVDILAEFIVSSWQGSLIRIKTKNSKEVLDNFYVILTEVLLK